MSLSHTITLPLMVGRTYKISGRDFVSEAMASDTVTVTSNGDNSATLDLTKESYSSYKVTSISLTYDNDSTLSDSVGSLIPTLIYTITPYYSNGNAGTKITSGATATYSLSDNDNSYFSINSSTGNVTAGTGTNYDGNASATVTVTLSYGSYGLSGENSTTATVYRTATEVTVTSTVWLSGSLSYSSSLDSTSYTDGDSISPELSYSFIDTYSSGTTEYVTSGATIVWDISDTTNFFIDTSGNVTALSDNYSSTKTATVTATITYNSISYLLTASVTQTAATDSVTSVEVSDISLTYYSDEELTTECSTLSTSATTLYPSYDFSITVTYNSGDSTTYKTSDGSLESFATSVGSYSLSWSDGADCDYASVGSDGKVTYGSGILIMSSETVMPKLTVSATVGSYSNSSYKEATITVSPLIGYLQIEASSYPSDLTCTLSWTTSEMTVYNDESTITSGTAFSVTDVTTLTCYLNVSGYSSGFAFETPSFSAEGYTITISGQYTVYVDKTTTLSATLEEEVSVSYTIIFEFSNSGEQVLPDYYYYYGSDSENWTLIYDGIVDDAQHYEVYPSSMPSTLYIGYAGYSTAEGEAVTSLGNSEEVDFDNAAVVHVVVVLNNDSGTLVAEQINVTVVS